MLSFYRIKNEINFTHLISSQHLFPHNASLSIRGYTNKQFEGDNQWFRRKILSITSLNCLLEYKKGTFNLEKNVSHLQSHQRLSEFKSFNFQQNLTEFPT